MKKKIFLPLLAALVLLGVLGGLVGYRIYQTQFIDLGEDRYRLDISELDRSNRSADYLSLIPEFTRLKTLDLRGSGLTVDEYDQLRSQLPDCEILWDIPFQGKFYPQDTAEIEVTSLSQVDRLTLEYFPQLKSVLAAQCPDYAQLDLLRQTHPDWKIEYYVPVCGKYYRYDTANLTITAGDVQDLIPVLPYLPNLQSVKFVSPRSSAEDLLTFRQENPRIQVSWHLNFHGVPLDDSAESLDFTGIRTSVEEIEALIPYLPNLTRLDLSDCGISNEVLDALNKKYESIKIVWAVYLSGWFRVKTDITTFMPVKHGYYPRGDGLKDLRYCNDIIALDVGHMKISNCDFVAYMPHMQYLILADTPVSDLTPLTGLKELIYLEIFMTRVTDYTPLLTCTALQDLNLCFTFGSYETIMQMTWLKTLWWSKTLEYHFTYAQRQTIQAALSNTYCNLDYGSSTSRGWRDLPNYFAQRDLHGMYYMTG